MLLSFSRQLSLSLSPSSSHFSTTATLHRTTLNTLQIKTVIHHNVPTQTESRLQSPLVDLVPSIYLFLFHREPVMSKASTTLSVLRPCSLAAVVVAVSVYLAICIAPTDASLHYPPPPPPPAYSGNPRGGVKPFSIEETKYSDFYVETSFSGAYPAPPTPPPRFRLLSKEDSSKKWQDAKYEDFYVPSSFPGPYPAPPKAPAFMTTKPARVPPALKPAPSATFVPPPPLGNYPPMPPPPHPSQFNPAAGQGQGIPPPPPPQRGAPQQPHRGHAPPTPPNVPELGSYKHGMRPPPPPPFPPKWVMQHKRVPSGDVPVPPPPPPPPTQVPTTPTSSSSTEAKADGSTEAPAGDKEALIKLALDKLKGELME